jgi:hypothetical protein
MMDIEIMTKRVEFIGVMKDSLTIIDEEGDEVPYFSPKFLIIKYLKMSEADLELNEKYKLAEKLAKKGEESDEDAGDEEDLDMDGEEKPESDEVEDTEDDSIDDEMLGDVQPESPETTEA